mgnify:CR=1 FL=1
MESVLLDTDIVSFIMKRHSLAGDYIKHLSGRVLCISFVTVGELFLGAEKAGWGRKRRDELEELIKNYVVLPFDHEVAKRYAAVVIGVRKKGKQIDFADAWIAATSTAFDVPLITHNKKHFKWVPGLEIISEYKKN